MKRTAIKQMAFAAITTLLVASCASEDMMDGNQLPEGKYPLEISAVSVTGDVQSRVAENTIDGTKSIWDGEETIAVKLDGTSGTGVYKINADGTTAVETQTYWSKTTDNVTAWYPNETSINLTDQSTKLAYAMKATMSSASYKSAVNLDFKHQLAKIRVLLTGTADMQGGTVQVKGYTTGTISNGDVTGSGEMGWITMKKCSYSDGNVCYEANVIPGVTLSQAAFQVTAQNGTATPLTLDAPLSVSEGGKIYEVTLTVNNKGTQNITLSEQGNVYTVASNASVIIDGGGSALSKRIVINSGASVMLKNVVLNATNQNTIEVNGTATLAFVGKNEINGSNQSAIAVTSGTLTINGTSNDQLKLIGGQNTYAGCLGLSSASASLIINGGAIIADGTKTGGAGIGSYGWSTNFYGGDITINGGNIEAYGGPNAAGIGAGEDCSCGSITITGGNITAKGGTGASAGIGSAKCSNTNPQECKDITITGKNTYVTATAGSASSDDIGVGISYGKCGTVTITDATVIATNGKIYGH